MKEYERMLKQGFYPKMLNYARICIIRLIILHQSWTSEVGPGSLDKSKIFQVEKLKFSTA